MRFCCVPQCTSSQTKKAPGVSFHEIPSDSGLRELWLKSISREDWVPNDTSNYSVVCSLHFRESDFRDNVRKRLLKPGAVPSVFSELTSCAGQTEDLRIRKRKREFSLTGAEERPATGSAHDGNITNVSNEHGSFHLVRQLTDVAHDHDEMANAARSVGFTSDARNQAADVVSAATVFSTDPTFEVEGHESSTNAWLGNEPGCRKSTDDPKDEQTHASSSVRHSVRQKRVYARRSRATQTLAKPSSSFLYLERKRWREVERALRQKNERLTRTVDAYKQELQKLRDESCVGAFLEVASDAERGDAKAKLLLDQVRNYKKKKPQWSETTIRHCIVIRNLSAKAYEYLRTENLLRLPCNKTLQKYIGTVSGEVGFSHLVRCRLEVELQRLDTTQSKVCSLIVDEMRIRQKLQYSKQRDAFIGDVDMGSELQHLVPDSDNETLANSVLCFLLCGLHARYKIPVGYFFTKGCTGEQLAEMIRHVIQKTSHVGFDVIRVVTDNHRINVTAMQILSGGEAKTCAPHPADPTKSIFLSFDQSHIIKNVRSQFLAKDMGPEKEISSRFLKTVYKMQKNLTVKPIRFLTRKHLYPTNIEKMSVRLAVQLFSTPVIAALKYLKDQAGHTADLEFASAGPSIKFLEAMQRWFTVMDVSNCQQYIHCNNDDARHFTDVDDARLIWLEMEFTDYIENLKDTSEPDHFFSKETYHALTFATKSNVDCVRHLLSVKKFRFVLTRKMSSDPIESMFGFLRRSSGCNDALDVKSAICGLEKMLKTGIVAASRDSNVQSSTSFTSSQLLAVPRRQSQASTDVTYKLLDTAAQGLKEHCLSGRPLVSNPDVASLAMMGGFIVRAASEHIPCADCIAVLQGARSSTPLLGLISHQDRGGLFYPTQELVKLLIGLRRFVDCVLSHRRSISKPLEVCVQRSVQVLESLPVLSCGNQDLAHRRNLLEFVARKFIKPLLTNYAQGATDRSASVKLLERKPLSRKVLKL